MTAIDGMLAVDDVYRDGLEDLDSPPRSGRAAAPDHDDDGLETWVAELKLRAQFWVGNLPNTVAA